MNRKTVLSPFFSFSYPYFLESATPLPSTVPTFLPSPRVRNEYCLFLPLELHQGVFPPPPFDFDDPPSLPFGLDPFCSPQRKVKSFFFFPLRSKIYPPAPFFFPFFFPPPGPGGKGGGPLFSSTSSTPPPRRIRGRPSPTGPKPFFCFFPPNPDTTYQLRFFFPPRAPGNVFFFSAVLINAFFSQFSPPLFFFPPQPASSYVSPKPPQLKTGTLFSFFLAGPSLIIALPPPPPFSQ